MIFYKNLKKHQKSQEKNLVFSLFEKGIKENVDDSVAQTNICKSFYNLTYSDGALKTGLGFKDLEVPASADDLNTLHTFQYLSQEVESIEGLWLDCYYDKDEGFYDYRLYFYASDKKLYYAYLLDPFDGIVWGATDKLTTFPSFQCHYQVGNEDCIVFISDGVMVSFCGVIRYINNGAPELISCVEYYDKLFGITKTNRNSLIYTTNKNMNEWSEADSLKINFLDDKGLFTKLVAFKDYVYLFRENGITRLSVYSSKNDFSITHLYTATSKIFEKSVCVCGNEIFFMMNDGLYTFNGNIVSKRCENYDSFFKKLDNTNCCCASYNGKYYISTRCDFGDDE
ncbi:MAG: hypothetical protein K2K31_00355, partial [Clostridia bacterium]|nr:hypothetical protein [Clostridia bacterium]